MRDDVDDLWAVAMDLAVGREAASAPVPDELAGLARRVVATGRRVAGLPRCPAGVLRRAVAIADAPPVGQVARLWALLFDSWTSPAPAMRGSARTRLLRYGGDGGAIDVEMAEADSGQLYLRGTVDFAGADLSLEVACNDGVPLRVPVRAGGLFEISVAARARGVTLILRSGRRVVARTPPLPPPS
ncbi:MAG TPA: hypothetical protein VND21_05635 [Planctomycetota bacterium]|nr:hypothetical protein [Planctomycetota bacterium]